MTPRLFLILLLTILSTISALSQAPLKKRILLDSAIVHFDFGKSDLRAQGDSLLQPLFNQINADTSLRLHITAHTDAIGNGPSNMKLSEQRAKTVIHFFFNQGIAEERMQWDIFGETTPEASNDTEEGRQLNRRATVQLYRRLPTQILKGKITDNETGDGIMANIVIHSKIHRDSFQTEADGTFERDVPANAVIGIDIFAEDYFFESQMLKTKLGPTLEFVQPLPRAKPGESLALKNFYFVGNRAILLPKSRPELPRLLKFMQLNPNLKILIEGHINRPNSGRVLKSSSDFELSIRRAKFVYDYLLSQGISEERIDYKGFGNWRMLFPHARSEKEQAQNRRVEIKVVE